MKKIIFSSLAMFFALTVEAQTITEEFESNSFGWTEYVGKRGQSIIKEGKLCLSADEKFMMSSAYLPIDPSKNFEIKADFVNTKFDDEERGIGIVINYMDDYNYDVFFLCKNTAQYRRVVENEIIGYRDGEVKMDKKLKDHQLIIKSSFQKLEFIVDNMKALEVRYAPIKYPGFGIAVWSGDGKQSADVERLTVTQ